MNDEKPKVNSPEEPDLEITVTNIWKLARSHPTCVTIEPRISEIKSLLKSGIKVAGVTSKELTGP